MSELLTAKQVMERLHVKSRQTLCRLEKRGLPHLRLGKEKLYRSESVEAFILAQEKTQPEGK